MKNFKEIAEKCLAGELSGIFVTAFGNNWHSNYLQRHTILGHEMPSQYVLGPGVIYNEMGQCESREKVRIIDFIPDKMVQTKIEIDIPEGKIPLMEQTEKGVVITWKEKELTYGKIFASLFDKDQHINASKPCTSNYNTNQFNKKVEVFRKLTNIRNYFGKPDPKEVLSVGWCISVNLSVTSAMPAGFGNVVFLKKEHAEQAIKMLGDELKYLFEPW